MKPSEFEYHSCRSVDEAIGILEANPDESKVIAGGQSLVPMLNLRLAAPEHLVDLNAIKDLNHLTADATGVTVGAMARAATLERSSELHSVLPVVREALAHVGHSQIRNRGTVVGSICHADPAAEMPAVFMTAGGEVTARSAAGDRVIRSEDFFDSYLVTALEPNEIVTQVRFDVPTGPTGWHFEEVARRHGDFALVGIVAQVSLAGTDVSDARFTIFGAGGTPIRLSSVEKLLSGVQAQDAGDDLLERAAAEAAASVNPSDDIHASADYRRHVAGVLVKRAIVGSLERARVVA